jgi:hypothetical protein
MKGKSTRLIILFLLICFLSLAGCSPPKVPEINWGTNLPVSSFEPDFSPSLWNDGGRIQYSTNCYAYALNMREGFPQGEKPQPGDLSGNRITELSADAIVEAATADAEATGRTFEPAPPNEPCSSGTYKVALVIAPNIDYHWYRQNPDGTWSHKPGHSKVKNTDSSGNIINDPRTADRSGPPNYKNFEGFYCVGP